MPELKDRFSLADEIESRDLWTEARRRAAAREGSSRDVDWPAGIGRRITVGAVAFAVFAAAVVFAWDLSHPDLVPMSPPPGVDPAVDLAAELPVGWSQLPAPPQVRRDAAIAWTGAKLIQWGGYVYTENSGERPASHEGSIYDAASGRWEQMTSGPLSARSAAGSAWSGEEFLIWGGATGDCCAPSEMYLDDGAAYDPAARTWRRLPEAPITARAPLSAWTGDELIVWGSTDRTLRYRDGAAYDPSTNTWRRIADGPIELTDAVAVWSGEEMYVFGAALHGGNFPETETAIGAAYDPTTDTWRELPPSLHTDPNANTAVWAGDRLFTMDYGNDVEVYRAGSGRWRVLDPMPLDGGEDIPNAAYIDDWVLVSFFGQVAAFSMKTEEWTDLTRGLTAESPGALFSFGPVSAGGVFLLLGVADDDPTFVAYRPPALVEELTPFIPAVESAGEEIRMPVTFPDGSTTSLVYTHELALAEMGVQPDVAYAFDGRYQGQIVFLHDPNASIQRFVDPEGAPMLINSSAGGIELWPARGDGGRSWIRFELPSWTVLIPIEMEGSDRPVERAGLAATVAGSLGIREIASGFPVVGASGDAELAEGFGEAGGAQLAFGDAAAEPDMVSQLDATIFLSPDGCDPATVDGSSACLGGGTVFASIYGGRDFVANVVDGLAVEDFRGA